MILFGALLLAASPTLSDLSWMEGRWIGAGRDGGAIEETWNAASGESMLGMFRMTSADGTVRFYEILVLQQTAEGPRMLLRHFDRNLTAFEEKDAPMSFRLASAATDTATFEALVAGKPERIVYTRKADALVIRLEKTGAGGTPSVREFHFTRAAPPAPAGPTTPTRPTAPPAPAR